MEPNVPLTREKDVCLQHIQFYLFTNLFIVISKNTNKYKHLHRYFISLKLQKKKK